MTLTHRNITLKLFNFQHTPYPPPTKKDVKYKQAALSEKEIQQVQPAEVVYKYKYNGKELQDEMGLNWYDYGARNYDMALGRWFGLDPLAEKFYKQTPYNYVMNNPILKIDKDGKKGEDWYDKKII